MKKTLVSALTTALVVGAASTTFAAANPFADVPADHWAYDAVAQLVQDGVVNGYSVDGTFKGDQNMSRYEMAQIVAKAMSKMDAADNNTKALIDKLAAEFSDELSNLGVRVADLEAKTDNVKWNGLIRYDWTHNNFEAKSIHSNGDTNNILLRLEPSMTINEHWTGHARVDASIDKDNTGNANSKKVSKIFVEGKYNKLNVKLGRFGTFSDASHGLVMDDDITGAEFTYAPTDAWKVKASAGRYNTAEGEVKWSDYGLTLGDDWSLPLTYGTKSGDSATYWGVEADYAQGKWEAGVGYHNILNTHTNQEVLEKDNGSYHVIDLGVGYAFDKNVKLVADYAWGPSLGNIITTHTNAKKNAYSIELDYKGAKDDVKGSWGAYVAYRQMAPFAAIAPTYDFHNGAFGLNSIKGWEIGASYTFAKNIVGTAKYFSGKDTGLSNIFKGDKYTGVFTRVDFIF